MPRSIRIEFAGAIYHVMARCNRRENIFMDDEYRRTFLRSLAEVKPLHQRVQNMVQTVTNISLTPFLRQSQGACVPLHLGLLCRMAHAPSAQAHAFRR